MSGKKSLSERDICTQYITPALPRARWDFAMRVREEVSFTEGPVIVRGKPPLAEVRTRQTRLSVTLINSALRAA